MATLLDTRTDLNDLAEHKVVGVFDGPPTQEQEAQFDSVEYPLGLTGASQVGNYGDSGTGAAHRSLGAVIMGVVLFLAILLLLSALVAPAIAFHSLFPYIP